ncbi:30S ribosomal protein S17 [Candidatus Microgenomates bacterium]|nr:MAG: 30S ribosomal protein S17 [Candidatus Microgenomates bacterium]
MQILEGVVISNKTPKTAIVEVSRRTPHKLYKKLIKKSKKYKVEVGETIVKAGDRIKIVNTRPISKEKFFKVLEVLK